MTLKVINSRQRESVVFLLGSGVCCRSSNWVFKVAWIFSFDRSISRSKGVRKWIEH